MQKIATKLTIMSVFCAISVHGAAISSLSTEVPSGFPTDAPAPSQFPSRSMSPSQSMTALPGNVTVQPFPIPTTIVNGTATYIICPPFPSASAVPSGVPSNFPSDFPSPSGTLPSGDSFPTALPSDIPSPSAMSTITIEPSSAFPSDVVFPSGFDTPSASLSDAPLPSLSSLPSGDGDAPVPTGSAPWNPCGYPFPSSFPGNGTLSLPIPTGTLVPNGGTVFPSVTFSVDATAEPTAN